MHRIGVLFGMEETFPPALVERVNQLQMPGVQAEFVSVGAVRMDAAPSYRVVVDRISHEIPFYRGWLKNQVLAGATVVNDPFWWSADDNFFNDALATRLGVAIPPTVLLPHKHHPPNTTDTSMRNLQYPLDWDAVFAYVGFPACLKPFDGDGGKGVSQVESPEAFFAAYDQTGDRCMTLQRAVHFTEYFRCYVVGQQHVQIMPYDPRRPFHERYLREPPAYPPALLTRVERDAITLCRALGYDLNTVEFAVEDGVPYAIDFMNPAPDAEVGSVGEDNFRWLVDRMAEFVVARALEPTRPQAYRWDTLLRGR